MTHKEALHICWDFFSETFDQIRDLGVFLFGCFVLLLVAKETHWSVAAVFVLITVAGALLRALTKHYRRKNKRLKRDLEEMTTKGRETDT